MIVKEIILHCSATDQGKNFHASDIDKWHRAQGWKSIGYHFVIDIDGTVELGRPCNQIGAHCSGHNGNSIGICYIGGLANGTPADTRTEAQMRAMWTLIRTLQHAYSLNDSAVHVHNEYAAKACPCFSRSDILIELARLQKSAL